MILRSEHLCHAPTSPRKEPTVKTLYNLALFISVAALLSSSGCAMFSSWKSIPPPGGCDQCHSLPISTDWKVTYQAAIINDERNRVYFQTEQYSMPQGTKPPSQLEERKLEDMRCFECHKSPSPSHKERAGKFHH